MRERFHAFNTARIVRKALNQSTLLVDHNESLASRLEQFPLADRTGVLYPGPGGRLLTEIPPEEKPKQLIVIDGTWHHAKTLLRDIPRLGELPRYRIQPAQPGRYRIRREPNDTALSTLEATVAALRALEPETAGWDELLSAFDSMVDSQLAHPSMRTNWRKNENRQQNIMAIPHGIRSHRSDDQDVDSHRIVVAYGESEPGQVGCKRSPRGQDKRKPIYWVAQRIGTGELFRSAIESPKELADDFLDHIGLSRDEWQDARTVEQFTDLWNEFVSPTDTLVTHHAGTLRLLRNAGACAPNPVILKSVKYDLTNQHATLESFLNSKQIIAPAPQHPGRADQRLANAIALTRYLHHLR